VIGGTSTPAAGTSPIAQATVGPTQRPSHLSRNPKLRCRLQLRPNRQIRRTYGAAAPTVAPVAEQFVITGPALTV